MLVVGDPFASPLHGKRVTIGNKSGVSGLNLGEDENQRAFILWEPGNNYLELGTHRNGITYGNTLVVRDGNVGIGALSPAERLTVNGKVLADEFIRRSSERWKTNVQPIEGALAKVQDLRGVSYDWKDSGKHDIGLIAEEVGGVVPEVVVYEANSKDSPAVDYAGLVPLLIEAIKEQQKVLEEKDTALADLEARVQALEEATITEAREDQRYRLGFNVFAIWSWLAAQCC
jgi:Chaperone of endosialidase